MREREREREREVFFVYHVLDLYGSEGAFNWKQTIYSLLGGRPSGS